jgi:hypothetical protein
MKAIIGGLMLLGLIAGCAKDGKPSASSQPAPLPQAPISNNDACASRLHDISGLFLMYLLEHRDLPATIEELRPYAERLGVEGFTCPISGEAYIYIPDGIFLAEQNMRVILYDPRPTHSNMRWAIAIGAPTPDQPPRTKVVALPEAFFLLRPAK